MIKFLHAADLHLDAPFSALSPEQAAARRQEQRRHDLLRDDFGVGAPRPGALGEGGDYQVV